MYLYIHIYGTKTFVFKFHYLISSCAVENAWFTNRVGLRGSASRGDELLKLLEVFSSTSRNRRL